MPIRQRGGTKHMQQVQSLAGDTVLRAVSKLLVAKVRSSDIVARWGGDEMVVVLWNTTESPALVKVGLLESEIAGLRVSKPRCH